jgi:hypothetical protein
MSFRRGKGLSVAKGNGWDMTSPRSLDSAAEWLRTQAGGILVLVVRGEDFAFAVDGQVSPGSAREMVELVMPDVEKRLTEQRLEVRARAKAKAMGAMEDGR